MKEPEEVKDIMVVPVVRAESTESVKNCADKMVEGKVGSIVLVEGEKPVGILTERDFLDRVVCEELDLETEVQEVMSKPLRKINPSLSIEGAIGIMLDEDIRRLPVVEDDKLVGIVTEHDIIKVSPQLLPSHRL